MRHPRVELTQTERQQSPSLLCGVTESHERDVIASGRVVYQGLDQAIEGDRVIYEMSRGRARPKRIAKDTRGMKWGEAIYRMGTETLLPRRQYWRTFERPPHRGVLPIDGAIQPGDDVCHDFSGTPSNQQQ